MNQGKPSGSKPTAFDGEEPTEVMPLRAPAAAASPEPEPEPEEENPDKQYVAPLVLPAARVPDKDVEGAKIVLNIPEPLANRTVADERARRRAPTVKISRAEVLGNAAPTPKKPSEELTVVNARVPVAAVDRTVDDPGLLDEIHGRKKGGYIAPAKPISEAPPPRTSDRPSGRALEPPATSMPVGVTPARQEKSKAPWLVFGILALGAAGAGVVAVTQGNKPTADDTPTIKLPNTAAAATAAASLRLEPPPPPIAPATATETALVASNVEDLPTATAADPPTKPTSTPVALAPSTPPTARPPRTASTATTARPTATARPTVVKTSDIPSGI